MNETTRLAAHRKLQRRRAAAGSSSFDGTDQSMIRLHDLCFFRSSTNKRDHDARLEKQCRHRTARFIAYKSSEPLQY